MPDYIDKLAKLGEATTRGQWVTNGKYIVGGDGYGAALFTVEPQLNDEADAQFVGISRNVWDELLAVARETAGWGDEQGTPGQRRLTELHAALKAKVEAL
jgi:hypothetical protein